MSALQNLERYLSRFFSRYSYTYMRSTFLFLSCRCIKHSRSATVGRYKETEFTDRYVSENKHHNVVETTLLA